MFCTGERTAHHLSGEPKLIRAFVKCQYFLKNVLMARTMIDVDRNTCGTKVWRRVRDDDDPSLL